MLDFLRKQMKWVMAIIVVAFLLSTFLMYEGQSTRRSPSVNADGSMSDYEVAKINGRSLMRSELEQRLKNYLSTLSARNLASMDMGAMYQTVLNQAILESQLVKEIDEQGINVSDAEAEQAMKTYADTYYPTRETFYQALANSGIKVEDYKRNLARQIAVDQLMTNAIGEINISEDQAVEFYNSMKNLFYTQPEGFMVHMADFKASADAESFRARLTAGESWDVIASEDKSETSNILNITKTPVFLPASAIRMGMLSALASVDIAVPSAVFSVSSNDFAVGMKTSHVDETTRAYDEVSSDIRNLLTQEEQRKRLAEYEQTLRTKAQVVINDQELFATAVVSDDQADKAGEETKDFASGLVIEDASKDAAPAAPAEKVEEVKEVKEPEVAVDTEVKSEEVKPEEPAQATPAKEEVKEEKEAPVSGDEPKAEPAPAVESVEEIKAEEPAPEAKSEDVAPVEAAPAEIVETVEAVKAAEEAKEEKEEIKEPESVKAPEVESSADVKPETVSEDIKDAAAEVKEKVEAVVETLAESLDAALSISLDAK